MGTHHVLHVGGRWVHAGSDVVVIVQKGSHVSGRDVALPAVPGHPQATQGLHSCALGLGQSQSDLGHYQSPHCLAYTEEQSCQAHGAGQQGHSWLGSHVCLVQSEPLPGRDGCESAKP
jgi:hypothetical protein